MLKGFYRSVLCILGLLAAATTATAQKPAKADDAALEEQAKKVNAAVNQAFAVRRQEEEKKASAAARRAAFSDAAVQTVRWINVYLEPSKNDPKIRLRYVRALFTAGRCWEYAEDTALAKTWYQRVVGFRVDDGGSDYVEILNVATGRLLRIGKATADAEQASLGVIEARILQSIEEPKLPKRPETISDADSAKVEAIVDNADLVPQPGLRQLLRAAGVSAEVVDLDRFTYIGIGSSRDAAMARAALLKGIQQRIAGELGVRVSSSPITILEDVSGNANSALRNVAAAAFEVDSLPTGDTCLERKHAVIIQEKRATPGSGAIAKCVLAGAVPSARPWVLDGVGALYETIGPDGPLDDARLYYLLEALDQKKNVTLPDFLMLQDADFQEARRRPYYEALARYFLLYLRETKSGNSNALEAFLRSLSFEQQVLDPARQAGGSAHGTMGWGWQSIEAALKQNPVLIEPEFEAFVRMRNRAAVDTSWAGQRAAIREFIARM